MQQPSLLLVDANFSNLENVKKMLPSHLFDIAKTGEECLEKLTNSHFDLVLLDYGIDNNKGLEVLNKIIQTGFELPVVMMIEEGRDDISFMALEQGATDYIMKVRGYITALPFTIGKVLERHELKVNNVTKLTFAEDKKVTATSTEIEEAYYILDRRGHFITINKKLETLTGYPEVELLELTLFDLIPREQESKLIQWLSARDFGYTEQSFKTELVEKYGNRKNVEIYLNPVQDKNGAITGYKGKLVFDTVYAQKDFPTNGYFDQTRMIQEMVEIINCSYNESLNHLLERITKTVCQNFQFKRGTLALLDRQRKVFVKQALVGYLNGDYSEIRVMEIPQDVIDKVFTDNYKIRVLYFGHDSGMINQSLMPIISDDLTNLPSSNREWHPTDIIILNLVDRNNQTFGYVSLDSPEFGSIPSREIFYNLELFGNLASLAIQNYYRFAMTEKSNRQLKKLLFASKIFKLNLSLSEIMDEIVWSIKFSLDFKLVMLALIKRMNGEIQIKSVACDDKIKSIQIKELKFSISSFRKLLKKRYRKSQSFFVSDEEPELKDLKDIYYHSKTHPDGERYWHWWALLIVPIRSSKNKIRGFLLVDDPANGLTPSTDTIQTLEKIAAQASIAIENKIMYLQLKQRMSNRTSSFQEDDRKLVRRLQNLFAESLNYFKNLKSKINPSLIQQYLHKHKRWRP